MAIDPYELDDAQPIDPYSISLDLFNTPESRKVPLVTTAVRNSLRNSTSPTDDPVKKYEEAYKRFIHSADPIRADSRLLVFDSEKVATESLMDYRFSKIASPDIIESVLMHEALKDMPDLMRPAYTSIKLPDGNPLKTVKAYHDTVSTAIAQEMERRDPSGWSMLADLGVMLFPGFEWWKRGTGAEFRRLYKEYYSLPLQDRVSRLDYYINQLSKMADNFEENDLYFRNLADYFFIQGPGGMTADLLLDTVDVAGLSVGGYIKGATLGKALKATRNALDAATSSGSPSVVGRLGARAIVGDAEQYGLTPFLARGAADPFDFSKIDSYIPVDAAGPINATIAAEVKQQARILNASIADIPQRSYLSDEQLRNMAEGKLLDVEEELKNVPHKAEIVESAAEGVRIRVSTYDEMALEGVGREQALIRMDELNAALENVQRQLDEWDEWDVDVKMLRTSQAVHDKLLVTKRNIISNIKDLDKRLARTPETVEFRDIYYTKNEYGAFDGQIEMGWRQANIASPEKSFQQFDDKVVPQATYIELSQDTLKGRLAKAFANVVSGLKRKDKKLVNDLLMHGDEIQHEWSVSELEGAISIPKVGTITLSSKQRNAYLKARATFKWLWSIENLIQHRILSFNDGRWVKDITFRGNSIDGVVYTKKAWPSEAKVIYTDVFPKLRRAGGDVVELSADNEVKLRKMVKEGKAQVVEFENPLKIDDTHEVTHGVVLKEKVRSLPAVVLPYRVGYVPMKRNVQYVVRENGIEIFRDGVKTTRSTVKSFFGKQMDAEDYIRQLQRNDPSLMKKGKLTVHLDAQLRRDDASYRQRVSKSAFSGIFSEQRLGDDIPYGPEMGKPPRLSAFEGMNRYMNHIGNVYPMNEWRLEVTEKYRKTAIGLDALEDPNDWRSQFKATSSLMPEAERGLRRVQSWLKDVLMIPDKNEMVLNSLMVTMARKLEKWSTADGARRWLMNAAEADAAQLIKGASFHLLLGWFNPRQLFVQAAGSVIAFSHSPQHAMGATRKSLFLQAINNLDMTDTERARNAIRIGFSKAALLDPDEAEVLADAWRRSGLGTSLRANVDYSAAEAGLPIGPNALRKTADAGLGFFRRGELTFRSYSWATAYQEFIRRFPKRFGKKLTQEEIDMITGDSMKFTLNLLRANKAMWQRGWMGIPTQFWQVQAKFWENMMPWLFGVKRSDWQGYRWQIWAMHAGLFGTMGIPFAEKWRSELSEWLMSPEGMAIADNNLAVTIQGGLTDLAFSWMLGMATNGEGVPFSISEAISIPEGALKMFDNFVSEDPVNARNMFGASWSVGNRVVDALTGPFARVAIPWRWSEVDSHTLFEAANDWASLASSWRNVSKARLWINNMAILDGRNQNKIVLLDDETKYAAALGKALFGARSYYEMQNQDLIDILQDDKELYKEFMDAAIKNLRMYSKDGLAPYGENLDKFNFNMTVLYDGLFTTEEQKIRARTLWWNFMKNDESELVKNVMNIHNMIKVYDNHFGATYPITDEQKRDIAAVPAMNAEFMYEEMRRKREIEMKAITSNRQEEK